MLQHSAFTSVVHELNVVDRLFKQLGFQRRSQADLYTYDLVVQDSSTRSSYSLRIPIKLLNQPSAPDDKQYVRFETPYLSQKTSMQKLQPHLNIPWSVWRAIEHKLAEIADYLFTESKRKTES